MCKNIFFSPLSFKGTNQAYFFTYSMAPHFYETARTADLLLIYEVETLAGEVGIEVEGLGLWVKFGLFPCMARQIC